MDAQSSLPPRPWSADETGILRDAHGKAFAIVSMPDPPTIDERLELAHKAAREIAEIANTYGFVCNAVRAAHRGLQSAIPPGTTAWGIAAREVTLAVTMLDG